MSRTHTYISNAIYIYIYVYMHAISNVSFPSIFNVISNPRNPSPWRTAVFGLIEFWCTPTQGASRLPNGSTPQKITSSWKPKMARGRYHKHLSFGGEILKLPKTETWLAEEKNNLWMKMYVFPIGELGDFPACNVGLLKGRWVGMRGCPSMIQCPSSWWFVH